MRTASAFATRRGPLFNEPVIRTGFRAYAKQGGDNRFDE